MLLPILITFASVLNPSSSYDHEFSVRSCLKVEVKKVCDLTVESSGHGSKFFKVYLRHVNGDLNLLKTDRLDVAGNKTVSLKFEGQGAQNILVVLFDKEVPVAIDGATILVTPEKSQLGEQSEILFDISPSLPSGPPPSHEEETPYDEEAL